MADSSYIPSMAFATPVVLARRADLPGRLLLRPARS
jgi:hypothetical protein